ncbi:MAG: 50S ribosomal protein L25 [Planctomycetota bacterium]
MHEEAPILTAQPRERTGSRYAKRARDAGHLPAIVYGHGETPVPIALNAKDALKLIHKGEKVFRLSLDGEGKGEPETVLLKELQFDYLGTNIIHADFARVDLTERVNVRAHLALVGDAKGLKEAGSTLMQQITELELECQVSNLPDQIEVDVSELAVGDSILAKDVQLPKPTMVLLTDPEAVVVQIVARSGEEEGSEEEATVGADGSPEVIGEKKDEG